MRLGFAIAAFLEADVLLLDEVFAVGDESFQRKCFGVIAAFKERGGTILFVSHDASAVERLCDRAVLLREGRGRLRRPGPRGDHSLPSCARRGRRPRRGADEDGAGGTGEARIGGVRLVAGDGDGAGPVPRRRAVRDRGRPDRLGRRAHAPPRGARRIGAARRRGDRRYCRPRLADGDGLVLRLDVASPPLQFGRFQVTLALLGGDGRLLDRLPRAVPFLVYPDDESRGLVRLAGTWRHGAKDGSPMSYKTCPDWPALMELAPDLQFKHMTVRDAQLPFDVVARIPDESRSTRSRSAATSSTTSSTPRTPHPDVVSALEGTHWFEVNEWATSGPGADAGSSGAAPHAA